MGTTDGRLRARAMGGSDDREGRKPENLSDHDRTTVDVGMHDAAHAAAAGYPTATQRTLEDLSDHDYTTVDVGPDAALTAINTPFSGTPTPLAAVGRISTGEITAQNSRLPESAPLPTAEPTSNPDPTRSTKLDPGFVHLVPGTLVDAYEVEKLLGVGGMGAVYGARHERLGRRAAIKVISPSLSRDRAAVERFEQEAQALARISHPNIVGVLSVGTLPGDGRAYFVMEWLDGESLQVRLDRGASGFGLALYIIDQIARGLEAAHAAGIVHRDLKPDNVWLQDVGNEPRPIVKILDFGLAKLVQHERSEHTAANVMFGTTTYMSPEQCRSARDVGPPTDVYALGCIAYELLCGRLPFTYDNMAEIVAAHQSEDPPRPKSFNPSIDPTLDTLLAAMLAKDAAKRPTLARVRHAVANALATSASPPRPSSPTSVAQPRSPLPASPARPASIVPADNTRASRRVLVALGGLVALGIVIAAVVARSGTASPDQPSRVTDAPRSAIEVGASAAPTAVAAPSVALDARVPLASSPPVDASTVAPRANVDPVSPSVARHPLDGGTQASEPTAAVEPGPKPTAAYTATIDASVEADDGGTPIQVDAPTRPTTTSPPPRRATPVPTAKKPLNRDVIINPFKKRTTAK
ncbi:MAG TPA: serine/threonine-protein kinase [Gemmatimonadaceae bacterium]|nr:serine/threonine-protein kinase [Gemmatimonadaceae bacterium]